MTVTEHPSARRAASDLSGSELREAAVRSAGRSIKSGRVTSVALGDGKQTVVGQIQNLFQQYAPLAYQLPWEILDYVELLATYNPDYSQAVENIKMLANSGHKLYVDASSSLQQRRIKEFLEEKARTIQEPHGGIDGVIDKLLDQAATFGAMCGEWIVSDDLSEVVDFIDVSPKLIRFFWIEEEQRFAPFQKVTGSQLEAARARGQEIRGNCIRLNEVTFRYYAFDAAPMSPYGTPPFLAALANIAIQRDMIQNMAQIVKKIGLLGVIDLTVERLRPNPGESDDAYAARAGKYLDDYVTVAEEMVRDGGLVHFDDVEANTWQIGGNAAGATNIHKQNEELICSGLKSMPSLMGRCLDPNTSILMADGTTKILKDIEVGDLLQGFDEHTSSSRRRWKTAKVENVWTVRKPSLCLHLSDGSSVTCSTEHPFLMQSQPSGTRLGVGWERAWADAWHRSEVAYAAAQARWHGEGDDEFKGTDWKRAENIREGEWIKAIDMPLVIAYDSNDYKAGYVAGANSGDGCFRIKSPGKYGYWQLAVQVSDDEIIDRCEQFAADLGMEHDFIRMIRPPSLNPKGSGFAGTQPTTVLRMNRQGSVPFLAALNDERDSDNYKAGWLAGMLDTDGSLHTRDRGREQLRFCQKDGENKDRIERYLADLGFRTTRHKGWIEVVGDRLEKWRLTASVRPVLQRKVVQLEDRTVRTFKPVRVDRIESVGVKTLIDITTTTSTFVGNGNLLHNSYSTTETYAGIAYEITLRNTQKYQRAAKRMIESGYWLMAGFGGFQPEKIRLEFNENRSLNRQQEAVAEKTEIQNAFMLWLLGIIDQLGVAQRLGYAEPKIPKDEPPPELLSIASAHGVDDLEDRDFEGSEVHHARMEEDEDEDEREDQDLA